MKPENGYIVDIAALKVRNGEVVDRFESLVNPGRSIVGHQIHGISDEDVAGAPTAAEVLSRFAEWVGEAPLVAHNVAFDVPFILRHLPNDTGWQPSAVFDTLELAYQLYPDAGAYKLGDLVKFVFGRDHVTAHRAMPDAEATAELFINLTDGLAGRLDAVRTDIADEVRRARESYNRSEQGDRLEDIRRRHGIGSALMDVLTKATVRELVLNENIRIDGRDTTTIRPISVEVGVLPRTHGSGIFTRGQTQALSIATLGPGSDVQRLDTISPETEKRYLHHYNFPPYSVGEARPMRGPGRREIGHGALAERALLPVLPSVEEFPYIIRVVSEVVSSNGSTSMASTCGSTLSLMDAGVPIKAPVAGAAMGLITDPATGRYAVLTDITGKEDAYGDMDFKVAGTADGVTALQMDIKVAGITSETLRDALEQARQARLHILGKMTEVISASREELSPFAPRITTIKIPVDKIRDVIGAGGKVIRQITAETGTQINVEDDGTIQIAATDRRSRQEGDRLDRGPDQGRRGRQGVPGQGHPDHELRSLRRDPARQGGAGPHQPAGRLPGAARRGRGQHRRRADGGGHRDRPHGPRQPEPPRGDGAPHGQGWSRCRHRQRRGVRPLRLLTDAAAARTRRRSRPLRRREAARPMGAETVLTAVASEVRACTRCPLHRGRTQAVPGEGNPISDVLLVGEGPGAREDATGRPFVGPAGQLLTELLGTLGWAREDVFIANVVKCRPPSNRDPEPEEIAACSRLPRPTGGGPRPGGDRDPGPSLPATLPARRPHLGRARATAPIGRPLHLPDVPSCCRAAPGLAAGDAVRRHSWAAGSAAGRSPGTRGRTGGSGPGHDSRAGARAGAEPRRR